MGEQGASELPRSGETRLYQPGPEGGPEPIAGELGDYRESLRSRRWDAAPLRNPEVEKTDPRIGVLTIVALATLTLVVLLAGYGIGLWQLPT